MTPTVVRSGDDDAAVAQPLKATETARIGMVPPLTPEVRIGKSLFERAGQSAPEVEWNGDRPRGSVTVPWWLLGVSGAALLVIGAATGGWSRPHLARASAPSAFARPPAPAPILVEPLAPAASPPPSVASPAPAPAPALAPVVRTLPAVRPPALARSSAPVPSLPAPARRTRVPSAKRETVTTPSEPKASPKTEWVDPFAD